MRSAGPPRPPSADDLPDIQHELKILDLETMEDDPEYRFAMAYVQLGTPAAAFRVVFPDDVDSEDDKKAYILGAALLNTPNVQVKISEIYDKVGGRLKITKESMIARLWQAANSPGLAAKEIPKLMEAINKIKHQREDGGDDGERGAVPQVHVHIGSNRNKDAAQDNSPRVTPTMSGGEASIPSVVIHIGDEMDAELPDIQP